MTKHHLFLLTALSLLITGLVFGPPASAGHGHKKQIKKGILLVTFGTSIPEAQKAFDNIDAAAKKRFPGVEIRWAFTAKMIRHKLAKQGRITLSPSEALAKMADENFTHVAVQSLHAIPGQEFHQLYQIAHAFEGLPKGIQKIIVGRPLLTTSEDLLRFVEVAKKEVIPTGRKPEEAVAFMGHGTHHPANTVYPALNYIFSRTDRKILVGTVEGYPGIDLVKEDLLKMQATKVWLIPLMSVAGDHARNDMAGPEPDSWKSQLAKAGISCQPVLKGLAECTGVVEIWLDHLAGALNHFK